MLANLLARNKAFENVGLASFEMKSLNHDQKERCYSHTIHRFEESLF